jgi:hypothetical protein
MDVNLIKIDEVSFQLQEDKCEKISHRLFRQLMDFNCEDHKDESTAPKMVVFKTKEEYIQNVCKYDVDLSKDMYINQKGNIFCFLNQDSKQDVSDVKDESTEA